MYSGGRSPSSYDNEEPALMYIRFDKKGYKIMPPPATEYVIEANGRHINQPEDLIS